MSEHYYHPHDLGKFGTIGDNRPELAQKFFDWYGAVFADGALGVREKALIALAVAHAVQCPYCIDAYSQESLKAGADLDQMTEAVHVAAAIRGGASLVHGVQMRNRVAKLGDVTVAATLPSLQARGAPLASPAAQMALLRRLPLAREFEQALAASGLHPLRPARIEVFQVNVGKLCNQTCRHCHVDAGPDRTEVMSRATMQACLDALASTSIPTVDITGGAPELNPDFRWLVEGAVALGRRVIDRCNLTVLETAPLRDLPGFLAGNRVEVVASLPHYRQASTDAQRGAGVYQKSIAGLRRLNAVGYGDGVSGLRLTLVTNPVGAFLPGSQAALEADWKRELGRQHGVRFDALYTITNMPISRYLEWLTESGNLADYMCTLVAAYNPRAASAVMCRNTISVGWDGTLYDCDFNQMLELPVAAAAPRHVRDFDLARLEARPIVTDRHCFGCTAGAGSSCGGATV